MAVAFLVHESRRVPPPGKGRLFDRCLDRVCTCNVRTNAVGASRETHGEDRAVDLDDAACGRGVARDQWLERIHPEAESQYDNLVREYYEAEADYRDQFHAQYVELKKFYDEKP